MKQNSKRITEAQVRQAIITKYERMRAELKRNPNNRLTAERLAQFKKTHKWVSGHKKIEKKPEATV